MGDEGSSPDPVGLPDRTAKAQAGNMQERLENTISQPVQDKITAIVEDVSSFSDLEKLLLYLKLPTGGTGKHEEFKPQSTQPSSAASRVEQTNALHWIRSHLEVHPDTSLPKQDVFDEYKTYCENMKYRNLSPADFGKMMKMAFPNLKARRLGTRGNSKYCYGGLRKKSELQPPSFPSLDLPTKSDQVKSSAGLLQSLSCPAQQEDDQVVSAASYLICEWAQGVLKQSFDTVLDLARYLILNNVVSRASTAAFTVLHAGDKVKSSPRAGSASGMASLKPLLSPSPFGKPLDAKQQLQRKIHRKQQAEQLKKLREEQGLPASQAAEQVTPPQTPTNQGATFQFPTNQVPVSPIKQTSKVAAVMIKVTNPVTASMKLTNQVPASSFAQTDKDKADTKMTVAPIKTSSSGDEIKQQTEDNGPTTSKKGNQGMGLSSSLNDGANSQDLCKESSVAVNSGTASEGANSAAGQSGKTLGVQKTVVKSETTALHGISAGCKAVSAGGVSSRDSSGLTVTATTSSSQGNSSNSAFGKQAGKPVGTASSHVVTRRAAPTVTVTPKGSIPTIAVTLPYIYKLVNPVGTASSSSPTTPTTSLQINAAVPSHKPPTPAMPVGTVLSTPTGPIIRVVSLATTSAPSVSITGASGHLAALATRQVTTSQRPATMVVTIPQIYTTASKTSMVAPIPVVTSVTMATTSPVVTATCQADVAKATASEKRPSDEALSPAKRLAVSSGGGDETTSSNSGPSRLKTAAQSENTPQRGSLCTQTGVNTQQKQALPHNQPLQAVNVNTLVADRLPQNIWPSPNNQSSATETKLTTTSQDLLSPNQEVRNIMQKPSVPSARMVSSNPGTPGSRSKGSTPLQEVAESADCQHGSNLASPLSHTNTPTPRTNLTSPCMEMDQAMRQQNPVRQDTMMGYATLVQGNQVSIELQQQVIQDYLQGQDAVDQAIQSTTPMSTPRATPTQGMGTPRATPTQEMVTPRHTPTYMSMSAPNSIPPSPVDPREPFSFMPIQQNLVYDDANISMNTSSPIKPMQRPRATHFNANNSNSNPEWTNKQQGNPASSRPHPPPSYQETIAQRSGSNTNVQKLGGGSVFRNPNESAAIFRSPTNGQDHIQQIRQRFIQERLGQNRFSNHPAYAMRRNPHRNLSGGSNSSLTSPLVSPCSSRSITPVSPIMEHGNQMDPGYGSLNQSAASRIHPPQSPIYPSGPAGMNYPLQNRNRHRNLSGSILYSPHHQSSLSAQLRAYTQQMHQQHHQQQQQQPQAVTTEQQPPTFRSQSVPLPELLNNIAGFNTCNQQLNVNQDYTNMQGQTNVGTYAAKRNLTELLEKESTQGYSDDQTYEDISNTLQANAGNYQENILQTDFQNGGQAQGQEEVQNQGYGMDQFGTQTWPTGSGSASPDLIQEMAATLASMEEFSNLDSNSLFDPSKVPDSDTPSTLDDMTSLHDMGSFPEMCEDSGAQGCGGSVTGMDVMGGNGSFALTTSTGYGVQGW